MYRADYGPVSTDSGLMVRINNLTDWFQRHYFALHASRRFWPYFSQKLSPSHDIILLLFYNGLSFRLLLTDITYFASLSFFLSSVCGWNKQPSLTTPFYSVVVSVSVFTALSTVFHFINSPDNSPLSYSVLPVLSLLYRSFQLYISVWKSPSAWHNPNIFR